MKVFMIGFKNIPKFIKVITLSVIPSPILAYVIIQIATNKEIALDEQTIIVISAFMLLILAIGAIIGAGKVIKNYSEKRPNHSEIKSSAFIAAPMMAFYTKNKGDRYKLFRDNVIDIIELLNKECGIVNIYYAGQYIKSKNEFHASDVSIKMNFENLIDKEYFILIYPEKNASRSALIESGYALACNKKSIYFFKAGVEQPYMLKGAANAYKNVKIYEFHNINDLKSIIKNNKKEIFHFK